VGWSRVQLDPGESKEVNVSIDGKYLAIYDEASAAWKLMPGDYSFMVGGSSLDLPLTQKITLK
jgi:beta-glucosidase